MVREGDMQRIGTISVNDKKRKERGSKVTKAEHIHTNRNVVLNKSFPQYKDLVESI